MKASVCALVALVVMLVPAVTHAATYEVQLCTDPQASGFVARNDNGGVLATTSVCPAVANDPFSGLFAGVKPGTATMARGTIAGWTVTAPAGTSFEALTARRRLAKYDPNYEVAVVKADGSIPDGCLADDTCGEEVATRTYRLTREVTFRVRCAAATCGSSTQSSRAWIAVEQARATIDDPAPPVIAASSAGGWQRTPAVSVSATDASGIASLALRSGDQTVGTQALSCDFRHLQPCPGTGTGTFTVSFPDGSYPLTAQATDAAGQTATTAVGTLKLDRQAPTAPEGLAVQPVPGGRYVYTWRNPDQGAMAPIAAAHLSDGTVVKGAGITQLESASPAERIYLEDEAGNANPATAVGTASNRALPLNPPILQDAAAPRIKLSSARRSGTRLIVKGRVTNATASKVTATVSRGSRSTRKSASVRKGRFTITISLNATMRRKGTVTLTVKHGGAKTTKRLRF